MNLALETKVNRRLTSEFIAADPKDISILRRTKESDGAGGYKWVDPTDPLTAQRIRLIPQNRDIHERETSLGTKVTPHLILLAEYDADIQRFDQYIDQGYVYEVVWVYEKRTYETKADVVTLRKV